MPASLNPSLSSMKARARILIPIALLLIAVSSCLLISKPSKEELLKRLTSQLIEEKFEQLYEEASDSVHLNVSKEQFVRRMKIAATKLKAIDENLYFQRDRESEMAFPATDESILIRDVQKLDKGEKSVIVLIYWDNKAKFLDLSVIPKTATSEEYRVQGVSYKHLHIGNRMVD